MKIKFLVEQYLIAVLRVANARVVKDLVVRNIDHINSNFIVNNPCLAQNTFVQLWSPEAASCIVL